MLIRDGLAGTNFSNRQIKWYIDRKRTTVLLKRSLVTSRNKRICQPTLCSMNLHQPWEQTFIPENLCRNFILDAEAQCRLHYTTVPILRGRISGVCTPKVDRQHPGPSQLFAISGHLIRHWQIYIQIIKLPRDIFILKLQYEFFYNQLMYNIFFLLFNTKA